MTQSNLFDPPPATYANGRHPGADRASHTSREAAASIDSDSRCLEVLKALAVLREATPDEIAAMLERHPYVVRPRCTQMQTRGFITRTGEVRRTPAKRFAFVLKLTSQGIQHLRDRT